MTSQSVPAGQSPETDDRAVTADSGVSGQVPFVPSDNTTLTSVVDGLAAEGFAGHFIPEPGGVLRCGGCDASSQASTFEVAAVRRLEGASDPDEMVSVVAATCPRCAVKGIAVLGFGPTATEVDADVVVDLVVPTTDV